MAINVSFNGATIYKPGAYSKTSIDLGGGFPLGPAGLVAIFGEADAGAPGSSEVDIANVVYSPDQLTLIKKTYGRGAIVDAATMLFAPASDGAIPSGASAVWVYKTNASVRAQLALAAAYGTVRSKEWGVGGNRITVKITGAGATREITISQKRDLLVESATVGGNVMLQVIGPALSSITIDSTKVTLLVNAIPVASLIKAQYASITELAADISLVAGFTGTVGVGQDPRSSVGVLDYVTALSTVALADIKKDSFEVAEMFALSSIADMVSQVTVGLPTALAETALAGGALGATTSASITTALDKFTKIRVNSVLPLFSRDATADIADALTDVASTYTIAAIHAAVKTHLSLMSTTKKKSERQGYLSVKASYAASKTVSMDLASARVQLTIQDIRQADSDGTIKWFQPWAAAALLAGSRGGAPVGTPLTFKFMNAAGIRHTAQAMSVADADIVVDFDPDTQFDNAIVAGITFMERPQTGGFRVVLDNTTYGRDGNWVYNRAHVLYAADILAFDFRSQLEAIYTGVKNTVQASEVKSTCESILSTYLAQGITVSTGDAKNGFKALVVQINGNTINISVIVKLVEGIDFILADITLSRASTSA